MIRSLTSLTCATALLGSAVLPVAAQADALPFAVAQASDTSLTCTQLAMETVKVANMVAAAARQPQTPQTINVNSNADNGVSAFNSAVRQAQLNGQLANIQAQAAQAGMSAGSTSAAMGAATMISALKSGEGGKDAAMQTAADFATSQLAARIPGGALVGGLVSGFFSHKKKAQPVADQAVGTQASDQLIQLGQQRMTFLQSLSTSKKCQ